MRVRFLLAVVGIAVLAAPAPRADGCVGTPGTLDPCFGVSGLAAEDILAGGFDTSWDLAVQADGKIVVAGSTRAATETVSRFTVLRYLPDGSSLDTSFGGTGFVRTTFAGTKDAETARRVAVQTDGKIVVLGQAKLSMKGNGKLGFAIARYNENGTLDTSFAGGKLVIGFGNADAWGYALALQADGRVVVGGHSGNAVVFARLNTNGSLDSGFGVGGKVTAVLTSTPNSIVAIRDLVLDQAQRIVAAGQFQRDVLVLRLTASGSLDTSFDGDGKAITDFVGNTDYAESVTIDGSGRIVVGGVAITTAQAGASWDVGVVRYLPNGALDVTFGAGGKVSLDINNTIDQFSSVVVQSDGHILVAGAAEAVDYSQADFAIVRLLDDGSRDDSFGINGTTVTDFYGGGDHGWGGLGLQVDGLVTKAVLAGYVGPSPFRIGLARYFL